MLAQRFPEPSVDKWHATYIQPGVQLGLLLYWHPVAAQVVWPHAHIPRVAQPISFYVGGA